MSVNRDESIRPGRFDVRRLLVVFLRLLALYWLVAGLLRWSLVLDVEPGMAFASRPVEEQVAIAFFAVGDLVAAVGLWLLASWGSVVWLFAALAESACHGLFSDDFGFRPVLLGFHGTTVVVYAALTVLVERRG